MIYSFLLGYGLSADAYHGTSPNPNGDGAIRSMKTALTDARLTPRDIGYINAHATSTPVGDAIEASAINSVFQQIQTNLYFARVVGK